MKIKDIGKTITGKTPSTKILDFFGGNIPFVTPEDLTQGFILNNFKRFISENGYKSIKNNTLDGISVLVGCIGSDMGNVAITTGKCATNQQINAITNFSNDVNPFYVYYYLSNQKKYLRQIAGMTTTPILPKSIFDEIDIPIFEKSIQDKIVGILIPIDRKIKNNLYINEVLKSYLNTLYEYWFLQYDFPNEKGKPYKSSGGKMVWDEELKREIPEGWKVDNLMESSLCGDIKAGVDYFETKNYLPTANINGEEITDGEYISFDNRESRANMQPVKNSVWFAKMKNSIKHLTIPENSDWFINKYILSTGFQGLKCSADSLAYIHCIINSNWFEVYKNMLSHGATQESVNNEDLKNIKFAVPSVDVLKRFSAILFPILEKKFSIIKENQELTALRDFLLPLLMNGQVTFKE